MTVKPSSEDRDEGGAAARDRLLRVYGPLGWEYPSVGWLTLWRVSVPQATDGGERVVSQTVRHPKEHLRVIGMQAIGARGVGIANIAMDGTVLDTWYPSPALASPSQSTSRRLSANDLSPRMLSIVRLDDDRMVEQVAIECTIADLSEPPRDAHDVYLRLHLLSHRLVRPNELNLDGLFYLLTETVWTNKGPCTVDGFEHIRTKLRSRGLIHVYGIDRFPRMVDYVVPTGVRIAEAERIRLGAYLAPGTAVIREGFVSFNAGTLGPCMVEGRLSSGVAIGGGSTIALGSTVVSPREPGKVRPALTVGDHCQIHANATVQGFSLGDGCIVDPHVFVTAETQVTVLSEDGIALRQVPASALSGLHHLHYRCGEVGNTVVVDGAADQLHRD